MLFRSDRKSTRLNSSHTIISYAVFCLKKKKGVERARPQNEVRPTGGRGAVPRPPCLRALESCPPPSPRTDSPRSRFRFFFLMIGGPPRPPLFPYTTLFR